ncbi:nicotianamine synthase family protein [Psychrobacillus sp. NEAU-3TGS]|uniref:nicotianamine synthase family protein n=1 Tax=Psychrobacillus sp. NEAU-3TGS TaxID=2995412 RepID=UPI0024977D42|nr:nicotianamine synthase family protein [Psychrobacillus sp. NEAU-3TGS]MDI2587036.1 nicotianamine synthase family protein [Psychrobacillus sp. NEAU-3TGS]
MEDSSTGSLLATSNAPSMQRVDNFIAFIREANELLQKETDLSPENQLVSDVYNHLLLQLRSHYFPPEVQAIVNNEYIRVNQQKIQVKLSEIEFLVELRDSHDICKLDGAVLDIVKSLPNWNSYFSLVSQELQYMRQDRHIEKSPIIFVGSGPMPISPIILHLLSDAEVICLEMNAVAYDASCNLLEHLGLGDKVTVILKDGSEFDYSSYSRIFVASLVQKKQAVLETIIRTSLDPFVAVRTAEGMRRIMYEAIDESQLNKQGWRILGRTSPEEKLVVNSTLFLERITN